jgi:hypothetical protein
VLDLSFPKIVMLGTDLLPVKRCRESSRTIRLNEH